ncbi:hypothetical protein Hanom_Chr09g00776141 [Helianthus anomalus]
MVVPNGSFSYICIYIYIYIYHVIIIIFINFQILQERKLGCEFSVREAWKQSHCRKGSQPLDKDLSCSSSLLLDVDSEGDAQEENCECTMSVAFVINFAQPRRSPVKFSPGVVTVLISMRKVFNGIFYVILSTTTMDSAHVSRC